MSVKTLASDGKGEFEVYDSGTGDTILFLHGFPLHKEMWEPQLKRLEQSCRVVAPDLRGFGGSKETAPPAGAGGLPKPVTMAQYADDAADIMNRLGIEKAVIAGFSMGGYIAFEFVRRYPDKVLGLVLVDTKAGADGEEAKAGRRATAEAAMKQGPEAVAQSMLMKLLSPATPEANPELVKRVERMMLSASREGIASAALGMAERADSTGMLPQVGVPALIIVGEDDAITPPETAKAMAEAIPGARLRTVAGGGHLANLEQPDEVNRILLEWLPKVIEISL
ncbi:alpha/beta fold hydrolase [Paenibacillus thermotolerans]|uniref:alpha/beta fold hydrolase n=1 Tax=Paenibacillus thermotolerans TaxID=3027807 RepID=UPI002367F0BF|nr:MULTISPECIES: alpha/beta fold hydrolase [unclassified Paenibacillus]